MLGFLRGCDGLTNVDFYLIGILKFSPLFTKMIKVEPPQVLFMGRPLFPDVAKRLLERNFTQLNIIDDVATELK